MTRTEYELIYDAFKSHRYKMTDAQEVLAEKILDDLFYPHFDALKGPVDYLAHPLLQICSGGFIFKLLKPPLNYEQSSKHRPTRNNL